MEHEDMGAGLRGVETRLSTRRAKLEMPEHANCADASANVTGARSLRGSL